MPRSRGDVGFKNREFLDFFFTRIRPNPLSPVVADSSLILRQDILSEPLRQDWPRDWSDLPPYNGTSLSSTHALSVEELKQEAYQRGLVEGYHYISPCGNEVNLVKAQDTPVVFRELSDQGVLTYAGSLATSFQPNALKVDPESGYLYHPSPPQRRKHSSTDYSLLASNLVLHRFADTLDINPNLDRQHAGSITWKNSRFNLGFLPTPNHRLT